MDGFSVRARAAVELGQQSENALSFLNRKTAGNTVNARGTAWPRDDAKRGAICQIVVRDTGLRRGEVLWRSVGLLVDGIGETKGKGCKNEVSETSRNGSHTYLHKAANLTAASRHLHLLHEPLDLHSCCFSDVQTPIRWKEMISVKCDDAVESLQNAQHVCTSSVCCTCGPV